MLSNSFINRLYGTHIRKVIESYYHFYIVRKQGENKSLNLNNNKFY